jgi:hypothetical protein
VFAGRVGYFNIAGFNELKEDGTARERDIRGIFKASSLCPARLVGLAF